MIKFTKRDKGGDYGSTVHKGDKKRIAKLKKDGYSQDHDYYKEDLADMAHKVEQDHEIQLARAELYKAAKYSIKLHDMLKSMNEEDGLEGWVSAKITKASDYLSTVYHHLDYADKFNDTTFEGQERNPAPDMNKYGIHSTKMKGEPFKAFRHGKQIGEFDTIEELTKFLTDLVNKESEYKDGLQHHLNEKLEEVGPPKKGYHPTNWAPQSVRTAREKPVGNLGNIAKSVSGVMSKFATGQGGHKTAPAKIGSWNAPQKTGTTKDDLIGNRVKIKKTILGNNEFAGKVGVVRDKNKAGYYGIAFGGGKLIYFNKNKLDPVERF